MGVVTLKRLAIIPARSGSKGIPDKNIRDLCGKPLLAYSIESAIRSGKFDKVFVSTDSEVYAGISRRFGADVPFLRSEKNAGDNASSWDVVREVLEKFDKRGECYDEIMLLQPTSPLRNEQDINAAISLFTKRKASAVESVTEMEHSPLWSNILPKDGNMDHFFNEYSNLPRQELPRYYRENGAIYHLKRRVLEERDEMMFRSGCYAYIMPQERSVDIDTELDFALAQLCIERNLVK